MISVVIATSRTKSRDAFCWEIKPCGIGLVPKTRQYFVILSNSTSFLSMSLSTMSFKTRPASNPRKPINTTFSMSSQEKPSLYWKAKKSPEQKRIGQTKKKCSLAKSMYAFAFFFIQTAPSSALNRISLIIKLFSI
jgi:hypothetical protein